MFVKHNKRNRQMSESWPTVALLTFSGGLQDAYSYCVRGKVFANAQTGNIVLMSQALFTGNWGTVLHYLIPLFAFACGVFAAEQVRARYGQLQTVHWRQLIVLAELVLLFIVGFFPSSVDFGANALVSFACAMQVQAFRKVNGYPYASTMCIGNLRSGMDAFSAYLRTREQPLLKKAGHYFGIIGIFALGAGTGGALCPLLGLRTVWICCVLLAAGFALMFVRQEIEENEQIQTAWAQARADATKAEADVRAIGRALEDELHQEAQALHHPDTK